MTQKSSDRITYHWCKVPGKFLDHRTGVPVLNPPRFTGTVREWYELLVEVMISAQVNAELNGIIPRGELTSCKSSPDIVTILECSVTFRPNFNSADQVLCHECSKVVEHIGTVSNRFSIALDRNLPREEILLGDWGRVIVSGT